MRDAWAETPATEAVIVCLGDMPRITHAQVDLLIDAYDPPSEKEICTLTCRGRRGNPVLWGKRFFPALCSLAGDAGAKELIQRNAARVAAIPVDDDAILFDIDTPADLEN